jgi:hypothetical protein
MLHQHLTLQGLSFLLAILLHHVYKHCSMEGIVYKFMTAPEKYLALWCGIVCCYIVYTILLGIRLSTTTAGAFYPGYSLKPR